MDSKGYKWLQEMIRPKFNHIRFKPPKPPKPPPRLSSALCRAHSSFNLQHRDAGGTDRGDPDTNDIDLRGNNYPWSPPGFRPPELPRFRPRTTWISEQLIPLCPNNGDPNSTAWNNGTNTTDGYNYTPGGFPIFSGIGKDSQVGPGSPLPSAWGMLPFPALQGEDGSGGDVADFLEDNVTYPWSSLYAYQYYDYDQADWLAQHLDELYEIMRSSQLTTNIALTVFLVIVFLFGVTGNILVLAVFSRASAVVQQQVSTVFIKALAITDLIICLVVLPGVLLKEWYIPYRWDAVCQGWELIRCSTIPLSTLILASVAVDRYVKICRVDCAGQISTATAKKILLVTATISVCLGIPPMLRVGVYQSGNGGLDSPNVYLGLCMGNDLLVSKETVYRYWQAMAAKFVLVLVVVMVMYGLVFRTVYKQNKRWNGCRYEKEHSLPPLSSMRQTGQGIVGMCSDTNKVGCWTEQDGQESHSARRNCVHKNKKDYSRSGCVNANATYPAHPSVDGNTTSVVMNDKKHQMRARCNENETGLHMVPMMHMEGKVPYLLSAQGIPTRNSKKLKMHEARERKNLVPKDKVDACHRDGEVDRKEERKMQQTAITKKRNTLALSFLCKKNDIETDAQQEEQDDGVTSLDDGHISYLHTAAPSSSQKTPTKTQTRTFHSAIFSCTSQFTVMRSAYISPDNYQENSGSKISQDVESCINEIKKRTMPQWLRKWKKFIVAVFFTTAAQKEEDKRVSRKLTLRQHAKIRMMNQEASCTSGIDNDTRCTQQPCFTSAVNDTKITRLTCPNNNQRVIFIEDSSVINETTLQNKEHSQDLLISNLEQDGLEKEIVKAECRNGEDLKKDKIGRSELSHRCDERLEINDELSKAFTHGNKPFFNEQGWKCFDSQLSKETMKLNTANAPLLNKARNGDILTTPHLTNNKDNQRPSQSPSVLITKENWGKPAKSDEMPLMEGTDSNCALFLTDRNRKPPKKNIKTVQMCGIMNDVSHSDITNDTSHKRILNSVSCPLPKMVKAIRFGYEKIHPLKSSYFSTSDSNIQVTQSSGFYEEGSDTRGGIYHLPNHNNKWAEKISENIDQDIIKVWKSSTLDKNQDPTPSYKQLTNKSQTTQSKYKDDIEQTSHGTSSSESNSYQSPCDDAEGKQKCPRQQIQRGTDDTQSFKQMEKRQQQQQHNHASMPSLLAHNNLKLHHKGNGGRYNRAQVKTAKVLLLVTVVYVLSFAPVLLMSLEAIPSHPIPFYGYFIHSAANPILYSFINEAFRNQLKHLICPCSVKN